MARPMLRRMRPPGAVFGLAVWVAMAPVAYAQQDDLAPAPRVALVIGNSNYDSVTSLPNPVNDAQIIAEKLWESGFEVIESLDADRETMLSNLATFRSRLRDGSEAVVYYAGHGVRIGSRNYLLPVSVAPSSVDELVAQSIDAQLLINVMNDSGAKLNIVMLDACRNNPFDQIGSDQTEKIAARALSIGASRDAVMQGLAALKDTGDGGLAEMSAGKTETLISFATAPGSVALDGDGRHSPYTQAIADNIDAPGLEISQLFRRVRGDVRADTDGNQITWTTSTLESDFYFKPPDAAGAGKTTGMARATDTLGALPPRRIVDRSFWRAIRDSTRVDAFLAYLRTQPDGAFADQARQRVLDLGGDPDAAQPDQSFLSALTRGLSLTTPEARAEAAETLERAEITIPIGAGSSAIEMPDAAGAWVYVPQEPRLGTLTASNETENDSGNVYWLGIDQTLTYTPRIGTNGGTESVQAQVLRQGGASDTVDVDVEAFVHACDMLAGEPQDSRRVTAGARQFILNRNFDAAIVACELAVEEFPDVPRFWAELARAYRAGARYQDAIVWQQKAAEAGYQAAVVNLGQMYLDGQAVDQDYARAYQLFTDAAATGEPAAYTALGWVYRAGVGVQQDYREAMYWYTRGADIGNDWAMTNIAELHQTGKGFPRDPQKAVEWYTRAAKSGELTAQTRLARMYQNGDGIPADFDQARFWYESAAGRGVPNAVTRLGIMYEEGQGQPANPEAAFRLYTRAAADGDGEAILRLGLLHASDNPLFADPDKAVVLLQAAVDRDVYGAHRALGNMYRTGELVPQDYARAVDLLRVAAQDSSWAARDLAQVLAQDGTGVQDLPEAARLMEVSARGGSAWAARDLARMYEAGRGVAPSRPDALIWYATAIGLSPDAGLRERVDKALVNFTPTDFVAAAQMLLIAGGAGLGAPDGQMGPQTRAALAEAFAARGQPAPQGTPTLDDLAVLTRN
ncbi:caspase family protein [Actibacterium ureilyticum]|uniref:caspase family protein n=1 Tax=Actibacterium ureilyticum TaxID=1590614 RepID=UPI000BAABA08|nr:caspase family protein [Actibacterium ureilyticum]